MNLCKTVFVVFFLASFSCNAQVLPEPGAKLHYNQVMFEYDKVSGASQYIVQLVIDTAGSSFDHCFAEQRDSATATMISGLTFGKKYKWRYAGLKSAEKPVWHGPYYFEVDADSFISKSIINFVVTKNDSGNHGLIVIDATHTIVDRNGNLVWYLADVNWFYRLTARTETNAGVSTTYKSIDIKPYIFDLRLTPFGSITYLKDSFAIECGLNNNLLWQAPDNGKVSGIGGEAYNHDFKRLPNGHYMVLGNELLRKLPAYCDTLKMNRKYFYRKVRNGREYGEAEFGTIIEYDRTGKVVWSWNSQNYLDSDALKPLPRTTAFEYELKPHINAFSTDAENQFVYAGFRDLSRIIKIEKSTGKVVNSWGNTYLSNGAAHAVAFHLQHDANVLPDSTIAVFNSNDYPGRDSLPAVMILSQQPTDTGNVIWRYNCEMGPSERRKTRNGGNVDLLKNGNYLVCTGISDRIFEITKDKKIVWQGEIKARDVDGVKYGHRLYRAHYVSSLYPCYFVFETDKDTISKTDKKFTIHLFNKGSEDDAYDIKVCLPSGKVCQQFATDTLRAGNSAVFKITPDKHIRPRVKIAISVRSKTNPDFERKRWIWVD